MSNATFQLWFSEGKLGRVAGDDIRSDAEQRPPAIFRTYASHQCVCCAQKRSNVTAVHTTDKEEDEEDSGPPAETRSD